MTEGYFELDDSPREECGVFGIYSPNSEVAYLTYMGLLALQHRGQDAAGIAYFENEDIKVIKDIGLVDQVFEYGKKVSNLPKSNFASGQVRYGTVNHLKYGDEARGAQPIHKSINGFNFVLSHNGELSNYYEIMQELDFNHDMCATDSELIADLIVNEIKDGAKEIEDALSVAVQNCIGAFSLVVMGDDKLIGLRDRNGIRPLFLGSLPNGGSILSSEIAAIKLVDGKVTREIEPGEMVVIDKNEIKSTKIFEKETIKNKVCVFEFVYFSRPDNEINGENVELSRHKMGQELALVNPVEADIIIGVPDSGLSAALGYGKISDIDVEQGLVKNRYVGRTFITPNQISREQKVKIKLSVNEGVVKGKRVVVVDDSIIRGTTTKTMVSMLKEAGATEVHLRISSAPYKWPCFYGMDTGNRNDLIAYNYSEEEIREQLGADSLAYLSMDALVTSIGRSGLKLCNACLTGNYPTEIPERLKISNNLSQEKAIRAT